MFEIVCLSAQNSRAPHRHRVRSKAIGYPCTSLLQIAALGRTERHLRPSVIFRKVTNGFRCEWGAETYAAFRSVVSTAKANRASVLDVIRFVLAAKLPVEPFAEVG